MAEDHVINRIVRLEEADRELSDHLQRLAVQTERVAVATEVLSEAMTRQYEQNQKLSDLQQDVTQLQGSMALVTKIGGVVLTAAVGIAMMFLFGNQLPVTPDQLPATP